MKGEPTSKPEQGGGSSYLGTLTLYLLIFLPAALSLLYVRSFGVDVPYADTWKMVLVFEKWSSGTLDMSHLWEQHYEHRVLFPRVAMLLLGVATSFDNVAIMYLIQACFLATLVALLLAFRGNVDAKPSSKLLLFVPVPFLVFNPSQNWNMLQAWSLTFVFVQTFSVLAFYLLYVSGTRRPAVPAFVAALASATVASFSSAQGLLVWPAGLLQLLLTPLEKPAKRLLVVAWGLVGLAVWVVYFLGWEAPARHAEGSYFYSNPSLGVDYFLTALGNSLLWHQQPVTLAVGLALACLAAASLLLVYRAGKLGESSFWVGLLSFSLLFVASITAGRSGLGAENALHSKYVSFSILAVIGIYAMLAKLALEARSRVGVVALAVLFALMVVSVPLSYAKGIQAAGGIQMVRKELAFILATYESQPDEVLGKVHTAAARNKASILERLGYSVFSEPRPSVLPPPLSALSPTEASTSSRIRAVSGRRVDRQGQRILISRGQPYITVSGQAVDAGNEGPAGGVYLDIDGELFPAFYRGKGAGGPARSGVPQRGSFRFERSIPLTEIGGGTHKLSIVVVTEDQKGYYRPEQEVTLEIV